MLCKSASPSLSLFIAPRPTGAGISLELTAAFDCIMTLGDSVLSRAHG